MTTLASTIDWLLEGDPAIRWQVMRDLLDSPTDQVEEARQLTTQEGWVKDLLDRQDPEGTWAGGLYGPKWTSTTYTMLLLWRCGVPPDTPGLKNAVRLLWDGAFYSGDGGLTPARSIPSSEGCVTAMYVALSRYFGFEDPRVDTAVDWLVDHRLEDGGWNCRMLRSVVSHSSFHTSITSVEALAMETRVRSRRQAVEEAMSGCREFFLTHRLFKSHRTGEVANPVFTKLSFPPRWHYDVLRGLDHFQAVDSTWDDRFDDALELLHSRQRKDGRWPVQQKHSGKVWFDMESGRMPSRWNTLRALRVLRWADRVRP